MFCFCQPRREAEQEAAEAETAGAGAGFNVFVDLCGIFKRSSIHDVRDLVQRLHPGQFKYIYHISPLDSSDRVLGVESDQDVQFDEEFFKFLCATYGDTLRERACLCYDITRFYNDLLSIL